MAVRERLQSLRSRLHESAAHLSRRGRSVGPEPVVAGLLAVATGIVVFVLASTVFEYHSSNHDEAVYLQQAAMLLEGQLELSAGNLAGAFRPWFFVADGGSLYPKYAPVPAAMYAVSMALFGQPRVTLAVVAAGNTALVYLLGTAVAGRRVGVVAALLFALSPMALVTSATFLPYAPTTLLNLAFAVAYLRGVRTGSVRWAGVAGVAVGLAFFARPYTALLFALPFVAHAGYAVLTALAREGWRPLPGVVVCRAVTAVFGLAFVGVTLVYNARLTGDPLVFPYEAFAPLDGPGFGHRRILGHEIEYTPAVAIRANAHALWYLATRWVAAGPLGTLLAAAGVGVLLARWRRRRSTTADESTDWDRPADSPADLDDDSPTADPSADATGDSPTADPSADATGDSPTADPSADTTGDDRPGESTVDVTAGLLLAGLFLTVPLGNLAFWGNYNVLATLSDPTDGFVSQFGPFYHFDLLAPVAVFGALALVVGWRRLAAGLASGRSTRIPARRVALAGLLATLLVVGAASVTLAVTPLERNADHAQKYDEAYDPIESTHFENALVFVPTPYGDWQNHPFQVLRNDPGFDGRVVYALDRGPSEDFAVIDAYPDRRYYRYTYRGEWTSDPDSHVRPRLEPVEVRRGERLDGETVVGVPERVDTAHVRLTTDTGAHDYTVADPPADLAVEWSLTPDGARLAAGLNGTVPVDASDVVVVTVTLVQPDGSTLTYRQEASVRTDGETVAVVWPPERSVCPLTTDCGREGTYLPDRPGAHLDGVSFSTEIRSVAEYTGRRNY